jgi:uncharacterized protein (TIGR02145 family)
MKTERFLLAAVFTALVFAFFACSSGDDGNSSGNGEIFTCQVSNACLQLSVSDCLANGGLVVSDCQEYSSSSDKEKDASSSGMDQSSSSNLTRSSSGGVSGNGFTDSRDGKRYKMVTIGNQTWMAENLNYGGTANSIGSCGQSNGSVASSGGYCDEPGYGRLYDWATVMAMPSKCNEDPKEPEQVYGEVVIDPDCAETYEHQGICPSGWHIPSLDEWFELRDYAGGEGVAGMKLKATSDWYIGNGTDIYGFAALPAGHSDNNGNFGDVNLIGVWWGATNYYDGHWNVYGCGGPCYQWYWERRGTALAVMSYERISFDVYMGTRYGLYSSVRCVKNAP